MTHEDTPDGMTPVLSVTATDVVLVVLVVWVLVVIVPAKVRRWVAVRTKPQ